MSLDLGVEEWPEEWKTLDMVHMEVTQEYVDAFVWLFDVIAEVANPTPGIENHEIAFLRDQFD